MKKAVFSEISADGVEVMVNKEALKEEVENLYKTYAPQCKDAGCMLVIMQTLDDALEKVIATARTATVIESEVKYGK